MLNNLKIGVRLTFSYLSGLFVMFGIVLFATIKMTSIDNEIQNIDKVQFPKTIWANNIINNVQEIGLRLREIPLTKDTVETVKLKARIQFLAD
ncbi:MAG: MCP four helix bundle domain-containing protein, partial [Ignavibacteriaceae bacterium]